MHHGEITETGCADDPSANSREVAGKPAIKAAIFPDMMDLRFPYLFDTVTIMNDSDADYKAAIVKGD